MSNHKLTRSQLLHNIAEDYVTKGLGSKNFDAIPYAENASPRAPFTPAAFGNHLPVKKICAHNGGHQCHLFWVK